jgi:hypothetical protein
MFDSVPPAEGEPISGVSSGWLWAPRCFALICILIAVGGAFHESIRQGFFHLTEGGIYFAGLIPYLAVLCFLFRSGKNPPAFALGMASATGFLGGGLGVLGPATFLPTPTIWIFALLSDFSAWLFWPFFISSMMLGLSAHVAFDKMRFEAKGTQRSAFRWGMFTAVLVLLLSSVVAVFMSFGEMRM